MPRTLRIAPSSASSPKNKVSCKKSLEISTCPAAYKIPTAIGKSNSVPSFFKEAGARFTVILRCGKLRPLFLKAVRIRWRLSLMAVSARPTIENSNIPIERSTSTSTKWERTPTVAADKIFACIIFDQL